MPSFSIPDSCLSNLQLRCLFSTIIQVTSDLVSLAACCKSISVCCCFAIIARVTTKTTGSGTSAPQHTPENPDFIMALLLLLVSSAVSSHVLLRDPRPTTHGICTLLFACLPPQRKIKYCKPELEKYSYLITSSRLSLAFFLFALFLQPRPNFVWLAKWFTFRHSAP